MCDIFMAILTYFLKKKLSNMHEEKDTLGMNWKEQLFLYTRQGYLIFYPGLEVLISPMLSYPCCQVGLVHMLYCKLLDRLLLTYWPIQEFLKNKIGILW